MRRILPETENQSIMLVRIAWDTMLYIDISQLWAHWFLCKMTSEKQVQKCIYQRVMTKTWEMLVI